jgi:hypothetical protein
MIDNAKRTGVAIEAHYQFLLWLLPALEKFPRSHKLTVGDRIETTALNVLEALIEATYTRERNQRGNFVSIRSELYNLPHTELVKFNHRSAGARFCAELPRCLARSLPDARRSLFDRQLVAAALVAVKARTEGMKSGWSEVRGSVRSVDCPTIFMATQAAQFGALHVPTIGPPFEPRKPRAGVHDRLQLRLVGDVQHVGHHTCCVDGAVPALVVTLGAGDQLDDPVQRVVLAPPRQEPWFRL